MYIHIQKRKKSLPFRVMALFIALTFSVSLVPPIVYAQANSVLGLPTPGVMVPISPGFTPAILRGVTLNPEDPLRFNFIIDRGNSQLQGEALEEESSKLIKYFLAALTVPAEDLWVNLSPYEENRIIPQALGVTEMGRDLLSQDYILKQISASLLYPEKDLGKNFWDQVYAKAQKIYGTTSVPVNTFNKVWIVPDGALVYENGDTAIVVKSHLKVMLEADYITLLENLDNKEKGTDRIAQEDVEKLSDVSSSIVKEVILPEIEREVNEGENFAPLRQIYHSMVLATWFKRNLKESILGRVYVGQNKTSGVDIEDRQIKEKIYQQYLVAFEKGVYNYIKEDYDPYKKTNIPRKYFSGGTDFGDIEYSVDTTEDVAPLQGEMAVGAIVPDRWVYADTGLDAQPDFSARVALIREKERQGEVTLDDVQAMRAMFFPGGQPNYSLLDREGPFYDGFMARQRLSIDAVIRDLAGRYYSDESQRTLGIAASIDFSVDDVDDASFREAVRDASQARLATVLSDVRDAASYQPHYGASSAAELYRQTGDRKYLEALADSVRKEMRRDIGDPTFSARDLIVLSQDVEFLPIANQVLDAAIAKIDHIRLSELYGLPLLAIPIMAVSSDMTPLAKSVGALHRQWFHGVPAQEQYYEKGARRIRAKMDAETAVTLGERYIAAGKEFDAKLKYYLETIFNIADEARIYVEEVEKSEVDSARVDSFRSDVRDLHEHLKSRSDINGNALQAGKIMLDFFSEGLDISDWNQRRKAGEEIDLFDLFKKRPDTMVRTKAVGEISLAQETYVVGRYYLDVIVNSLQDAGREKVIPSWLNDWIDKGDSFGEYKGPYVNTPLENLTSGFEGEIQKSEGYVADHALEIYQRTRDKNYLERAVDYYTKMTLPAEDRDPADPHGSRIYELSSYSEPAMRMLGSLINDTDADLEGDLRSVRDGLVAIVERAIGIAIEYPDYMTVNAYAKRLYEATKDRKYLTLLDEQMARALTPKDRVPEAVAREIFELNDALREDTEFSVDDLPFEQRLEGQMATDYITEKIGQGGVDAVPELNYIFTLALAVGNGQPELLSDPGAQAREGSYRETMEVINSGRFSLVEAEQMVEISVPDGSRKDFYNGVIANIRRRQPVYKTVIHRDTVEVPFVGQAIGISPGDAISLSVTGMQEGVGLAVSDGEVFDPIGQGAYFLGRKHKNPFGIVTATRSVSRDHLEVQDQGNGFVKIRDTSSPGTVLRIPLKIGDNETVQATNLQMLNAYVKGSDKFTAPGTKGYARFVPATGMIYGISDTAPSTLAGDVDYFEFTVRDHGIVEIADPVDFNIQKALELYNQRDLSVLLQENLLERLQRRGIDSRQFREWVLASEQKRVAVPSEVSEEIDDAIEKATASIDPDQDRDISSDAAVFYRVLNNLKQSEAARPTETIRLQKVGHPEGAEINGVQKVREMTFGMPSEFILRLAGSITLYVDSTQGGELVVKDSVGREERGTNIKIGRKHVNPWNINDTITPKISGDHVELSINVINGRQLVTVRDTSTNGSTVVMPIQRDEQAVIFDNATLLEHFVDTSDSAPLTQVFMIDGTDLGDQWRMGLRFSEQNGALFEGFSAQIIESAATNLALLIMGPDSRLRIDGPVPEQITKAVRLYNAKHALGGEAPEFSVDDTKGFAHDERGFWGSYMTKRDLPDQRVEDDAFVQTVMGVLPERARVLTLGEAPTTIDLREMLAAGHEVLATDFSREVVDHLEAEREREGHTNLEVRELDHRNISSLDDDSFDTVVSRLSVGIFTTNEEFDTTLGQVVEKLRKSPNSRLVLQVRTTEDSMYDEYRGRDFATMIGENTVRLEPRRGRVQVRNFWTQKTITAALERAGFRVESLDSYTKTMYKDAPDYAMMTVVAKLDDSLLAEGPAAAELSVDDSTLVETVPVLSDKNIENTIQEWVKDRKGSVMVKADDGRSFKITYEERDDDLLGVKGYLSLYDGNNKIGLAHFSYQRNGKDVVLYSSHELEKAILNIEDSRLTPGEAIIVAQDYRDFYGNMGSTIMSFVLRLAKEKQAERVVAVDVQNESFFEGLGMIYGSSGENMSVSISEAVVPEIAFYRKDFDTTLPRWMSVAEFSVDDSDHYIYQLEALNPDTPRYPTARIDTSYHDTTTPIRFPTLYGRVIEQIRAINESGRDDDLQVMILGPGSQRSNESEPEMSFQTIEMAALLHHFANNKIQLTVVDGNFPTVLLAQSPTQYTRDLSMVPADHPDLKNISEALASVLKDATASDLSRSNRQRFDIDRETLDSKVDIGGFYGLFENTDFGEYPNTQLDMVVATIALGKAFGLDATKVQHLNLLAKVVNTTKREGQGKVYVDLAALGMHRDIDDEDTRIFPDDFSEAERQKFFEDIALELEIRGLVVDIKEHEAFSRTGDIAFVEITNKTPKLSRISLVPEPAAEFSVDDQASPGLRDMQKYVVQLYSGTAPFTRDEASFTRLRDNLGLSEGFDKFYAAFVGVIDQLDEVSRAQNWGDLSHKKVLGIATMLNTEGALGETIDITKYLPQIAYVTGFDLQALREKFKVEIRPPAPVEFSVDDQIQQPERVGGIDINPNLLDIQIEGEGLNIDFKVDPQMIEMIPIDGFAPVIFQITPVNNLPMLLGESTTEDPVPAMTSETQKSAPKKTLEEKPTPSEPPKHREFPIRVRKILSRL